MKRVKEVRYGEETVIKRIYLGTTRIYDSRTFIVKCAYGDMGVAIKALLDRENITNASMMCDINMYVIANADLFDDTGLVAKDDVGNIVAYAVLSSDDIKNAIAHGSIAFDLETIANGDTDDVANASSISSGDIAAIGHGENHSANEMFSALCGYGSTKGDCNNINANNMSSIDNKLCVVKAVCNDYMLLEIAMKDDNLITTIGAGDNDTADEVHSIDKALGTIIGAVLNRETNDIESKDITCILTVADAYNLSTEPTYSHAKMSNISLQHADPQPTHSVDAYAQINIESQLNTYQVDQTNANSKANIHIITSLGDLNKSQNNVNACTTITDAAKAFLNQPKPNDSKLSDTISVQTSAATWSYPKQNGDTLLIFQSLDVNYNKETNTLEII
jgi:hypothetical protein